MSKRNHKKQITNNKNKGVAILFAVLVTVMLVSIGISIVSIGLRQTVLSSTGRESQIAFYVANTALECARFWDLNPPGGGENGFVFPTELPLDPSELEEYFSEEYVGDVSCAGNNLDLAYDDGVTTFELIVGSELEGVDTYCANVTVTKDIYTNPDDSQGADTLIEVRGYNSSSCNEVTPRTVERGLEIYYRQ
jgi:hypothetical protein